MSTFNDKQQEAFVDEGWAWAALPTWAKAITWVIGLPAFLLLVYLVFAGEDRASPNFIPPMVAFFGVCLMQIYCANRAFKKLSDDD
ncbi:hypothetical protein FHS52_001916 [Erythromicrobium ramosum]|uniref:Uncharacterized protein n=1 Tax=Erythrobacter ramosus TaxID=35811 RepID=A0A6I4UNE1_9SPHN|nr:hypothetical protein [Erythrobacter ramosus]MBB3775947.1 hypothetical protein [Erythrobacter ramosus]MXP38963.1 hypothetical protein [Erythrobacter ramosus]